MGDSTKATGTADLTLDEFFSRDRAMQRCLELARVASKTDELIPYASKRSRS